jgi:hypothetical protein
MKNNRSNPKRMSRALTCDEQLALWVSGESIHNSSRDECCPDFSCCNPEIRTPIEERRRFASANESERSRMLGHFLGQMIARHAPKKRVLITGAA